MQIIMLYGQLYTRLQCRFWGNEFSPTIGNKLVPVGPVLALLRPAFGL